MGSIDINSLKKLVSIEKQLFKAKSCEELLKRITKEAISLLDIDVASIFSLDYREMTLIGEAVSGIDERMVKNIRFPLSYSKTAFEAFKTKKPVTVFDVRKEGKIPQELVEKHDFRSSLTLPLIGMKKKTIGFLYLDIIGKTKRFSPEEKILAECFANLATISIEQTKLREGFEKKIEILSAYSDIFASTSHSLNIEDFMKRILQNAAKVLKMDGGLIHIIEDGKLTIKSHIGIPRKYLKKYSVVKIGHHIAGTVAKTQESIIIEDGLKDQRATKEAIRIIGYRSLFSIPLLAEDRVVGVLSVTSKEKRKFEQEEIDFFNNTGRQIGAMFENAMLFERMKLSNKKIKALVELNRSIVSILDLPLLYRKVLNELPSIISCYTASVMLVDKKSNELKVVSASAYGPKRRERESIRIKVGNGIVGRVAKTGRTIIIGDVRKRKSYIGKLKEIRSEIAVPLSVKGRIIGVLNVESNKVYAYTSEDIEILTAFANELAIAIENAKLYQESKERTTQLELINRVIKEIGKAQDINIASQKICKAIQGHFYYDHTLLFFLDEEKKNLVLKGYAGLPYRITEFHQSIQKGLLGLCLRTRRSILENNTKRNRDFVSQLPKEEAALSEMDIPLIFGNEVFGVLSLQSKTQDAFGEWDLVTMETISEHVASSLNNSKLYSGLRQRLSELSNIYEIGVDLSISRNVDELLEKMYRRTRMMTGASTFYIALYNEEDKTVTFEIDYEEGKKRPQETIKLDKMGGYTGWILKNNSAILIRDFKQDSKKYPAKPILNGLRMNSYLGIPIRFEDKVIGVLSLQSRKSGVFNETTLSLFTTFANQLGVVIENARLFTEMDIVLDKLEHSYDETLRSLVSALDFRESETQYHSIRVAVYAVELAKRINIPEEELKFIYWGGILHDIGKIGVPDNILLKPSKLTEDEWKEIRKHPRMGYEIVKDIKFLRDASEVILFHHEWWNGRGYPYGISKKKIPMWARIFSIADALDSMTSKRPYKDEISLKEAYKEIQRCSGTQFDPEVVNIFSKVPLKFWERIKKSKAFNVEFKISHIEDK